jgi:DNA topoisomerase-3
VDRFLRIENFIPETFWKIDLQIEHEKTMVAFRWRRIHLFDRQCCLALYEMCVERPLATVTSVRSRPTSKW